jgi:hypothetical protein
MLPSLLREPVRDGETLSAHRPALMSGFVLRLFADLILRPDNFTEVMMIVRLGTFFADRHSFVAGRQ